MQPKPNREHYFGLQKLHLSDEDMVEAYWDSLHSIRGKYGLRMSTKALHEILTSDDWF